MVFFKEDIPGCQNDQRYAGRFLQTFIQSALYPTDDL